MSTFVFPIPQASAAIAGGVERFPVRRIYCVGRNYADHTREMGGDPSREPPFFFSKFPDALVASGGAIAYPTETADFQFEAELVVAIGAPARAIAATHAESVVFGFACGLDMTRRDVQSAARKEGRPWDMAKNFTGAAPLGAIHRISETGIMERGALQLTVNGAVRQSADLSDMIWPVRDIIAHLSRYDALAPGDLIFTGTPAGVGPVQRGDRLRVAIAGLSDLEIAIGEE